ncbi:MAG: SDR family oxidoreductase [Pseudonocardia sp.]
MFDSLMRFFVRRRTAVIWIAVVLFVVAGVVGNGVQAHLTSGGFEDPNAESSAAAETLARDFGQGDSNVLLLVTAPAGVDDPAVTRAGLALTREFAQEPGVVDTLSYWSTQRLPALASSDKTQALVQARILGSEEEIDTRVAELVGTYTRSSAQLTVGVGGSAAVTQQIRDTVEADLVRSELIAFPILLVLLLLVFGSVVAALLPLAVAALAVTGTLAILQLLVGVTDISIYALNLAAGLGLGLAVDYSLFMVSRFREELAAGHPVSSAVHRTMRSAGRTVAFSGVTVVISLSALLIFPQAFMRSFAYAGVAVVTVAMAGALVVLPALLATLGHRVNSLRVLRRPAAAPGAGREGPDRWRRFAEAVMRRPIPVVTGVIVILLLLGAPFLNVRFGGIDSRVLPADNQARMVTEQVRQDFGGSESAATTVVVPGSSDSPLDTGVASTLDTSTIDAYAAELSTVAGVDRVDAVTGSYVDGVQIARPGPASARFAGTAGTWLSVVPAVQPISPAGEDMVRDLRAVAGPTEGTLVGGPSAAFVDSQQTLLRLLPLAIALIAAVTFILLLLMFGSLLVPTKALVLNMLSLTAMFGAMVWVFQEGHLSDLLGFTATGTLDLSIPILMFCLAFGVSMDYEVFLLSRIKEAYDRTGDNAGAVATGLARTGGIITAAALLLATVLVIFATSGVTLVKLFGLGIALAVVIDATLVRLCLVPAVMKLAGRANWWLPRRLRPFHDRFQITHHVPAREEDTLSNFTYVAATLPGLADPTIAIAASRAGAIGVVDLTFIRDEKRAVRAVTAFERSARTRGGIRIDPRDEGVVDAVTSAVPQMVEFAILVPTDHEALRRQAKRLRTHGLQLWLEVTSLDEAALAGDLEFDGMIAKGGESGGRVRDTTTFVLLQELLAKVELPIWAQGGVGEHTAAACATIGAAGVVLDAQLALTWESRLPEPVKAEIRRMEGTETAWVGLDAAVRWRVFERPGYTAAEELRQLGRSLATQPGGIDERDGAWNDRLAELVGWTGPGDAWLLGQDAAFAAPLAERFHTVGGVLTGLRQAVDEHLALAAAALPLAENGPLATSHGTRYPIVQGPMTRVSDVAGFAREVATAGALPFLALALMRGQDVETLLRETERELDGQPWGAGILGFVPLELREEQLAAFKQHPPSFALIAGGRPDQALRLERDGIPTYLHVPSPGLLRLFISGGAHRFVFEGRECGGHVGPRSSFVLWNTMIDVILASMPPEQLPDCHVLFAGGVHDAASAAMVAAMAAPLADRGVKVGVLLGTAYLFTEEAVSTGAITPTFQRQALRCTGTRLLQSGPGHATRCADTPFATTFEQEQQSLIEQGRPAEEIRAQLELLNLGRARVASKGINRNPEHGNKPGASEFVTLKPDEQFTQGMYMLGQVAALHRTVLPLAELHHDVSVAGSALLARVPAPERTAPAVSSPRKPCDIAIVGMSAILPGAPDLDSYWQNILAKVNAITEVPAKRWDVERYYDPDPSAPDKVYSKWGGFLDPVQFDPVHYGMPPNSLPSIEPVQLLALEAVQSALEDAGYQDRPFPREQTGVIFGVGGMGDHGILYGVRSGLPAVIGNGDVPPEYLESLPTWTEDSFPGILSNVIAGRVANRFNFGGTNHTVDAACAASLAAVYLAVRELECGSADMMVVGGADSTESPFAYLCFSKTHALSPQGRSRPFDADTDGIVISEGLGVLVLKRLADAERDSDRIYAVIKGVGSSSDGRDRSLTSPRPEGQARALRRAYANAGFSPATVGLVEAHGTGTVVGDRAEVDTLNQVFREAGAPTQQCAIGSVKSMIGHTKGTAGVAGLIKVSLGLHHKVLPPTLGVERPNPAANFSESPFYVNSDTRPWLHTSAAPPRRAGVSAFGFGGTNFHIALEEYTDDYRPGAPDDAPVRNWPTELCFWTAGSREELREQVVALEAALAAAPTDPPLVEIAHAVWARVRPGLAVRLAIVATTIEDLRSKLASARDALSRPDGSAWTPEGSVWDRRGVYLTTTPLALGREATVAFLYPGQGSQHPDMLRDLAIHFPEVRQAFELADTVLADRFDRPLSAYVFPPPGFSREDEQARSAALQQTDRAQPALGAAAMGLTRLLDALGVRPALTGGHSYGEYVALCAAGVLDEEVLYHLSETRGRCIIEAAEQDLGTMAAVSESPGRVQELLDSVAEGWAEEVWVANLNGPKQTVISGSRSGIEQASRHLTAAGITTTPLPVACGFHSPLVAPARERLAEALADLRLRPSQLPVYSNTSATPYPAEPDKIVNLLADHLVQPVRFAEQIDQMYAAGARLFVEVGPGGVLSGLVNRVLGARPHLAVQTQGTGCGFTVFQHALAQLSAHGVDIDLDRLYEGRVKRQLNLDTLADDLTPAPLSPTTWLVDGGSARPVREASAVQKRSVETPARAGEAPVHASTETTPTTPGAMVPTRVGQDASHGNGAHPAPHGQQATSDHTLPGRAEPAAASVPAPSTPDDGDEGDSEMIDQFQQLMARFLDVQQEVMVTYLQGTQNGSGPAGTSTPTPAAPAAAAAATPTLPPVRALTTPSNGQPKAESAAPPVPPPAAPAAPPVAPVSPPAAPVEEATAPAAQPAPPAPEPELPRAEQIASELVRLVAERTGYPPEMLGLDIDMEAELGIDSIKRVEILAAAQQSLQLNSADSSMVTEEHMETLTKARTLRGLVEAFLATASTNGIPTNGSGPVPADGTGEEPPQLQLNGTAPDPAAQPASATVATPASDAAEAPQANGGGVVPRFFPRAVDVPLGEATRPLSGVIAITDDEQGVARALAESLRGQGIDVALIRDRQAGAGGGPGAYAAALGDAKDARRVVQDIRGHQGAVTGLVHLLPLRSAPSAESLDTPDPGWQARVDLETRSLFHLAQALSGDLRQAGTRARLVAATRIDGAFGYRQPGAPFPPSHGGAAGLVKTLAREWPEVHCTVVDLDPALPDAAQRLAAELVADDEQLEVGWSPDRRVTVRLAPAPLPTIDSDRPVITKDSVVLVTGGARGITATVTCEIARRYQPTIVIVGRSAPPADTEAADVAGLTEAPALKGALAARLRSEGSPATPARVEPLYRSLIADREMRANLQAMADAGARVHYHQLDVRDTERVTAFVEDVYAAHGRIDGVLHGAGVIEDKLVEDKTTDSFDRVVQTKTAAAFALARALRPESLTFLAFFSSISARFGNPGQGDYAAANEVLNKLAAWLDARWPARVVSCMWGPWKTGGMVSDELERMFNQRGVQLIHPAQGAAALIDELNGGRKGDVEVLFGSGPWQVATPLLDGATVSQEPEGNALTRALHPDRDLYLRDHLLDGHPVLPAAGAMEMMAEFAAGNRPGLEVAELRDVQVVNGVILGDEPCALTVRAVGTRTLEDGATALGVTITDTRNERLAYRAEAVLRQGLPAAPAVTSRGSATLEPFPMPLERAYDELLFHGPLLQGITRIEGIDDEGIVVTLQPSSPAHCLVGAGRASSWTIDPVLIDSAFQAVLLWARVRLDITVLPSRIRHYRRFAALPETAVRCEVRIRPRSGGHVLDTEFAFRDEAGQLLAIIDEMEFTGSRSLNRLAGASVGGSLA